MIGHPQASVNRPIDRMLAAFPGARPCGKNGWYSARCSAHDDKSASLSFREGDDGGVIIKCHAGCEPSAVREAAGLTWKDLSPRSGYRPTYTPRPKLELIDLAADKLLPWQFLFNLGIEDGYSWHGSSVIKIPYYLSNGEEHSKVRVRTALSGNRGSRWDEDTPGEMIPYGLNKLDMARKQGYLLAVEGESDCWTCWAHEIPCLGVPGATNEKCLDGKILADIPRIYIIQEPDKAGQAFYKRVHQQLRATSYKGELFALPFKKLTGCKDPNELHKRLKGQGFKEAIAKARENAIPSGDEIDRTRPPKPQSVADNSSQGNEETDNEQEYLRYEEAVGLLTELYTYGLELEYGNDGSYKFRGNPLNAFTAEVRENFNQRIMRFDFELRDLAKTPEQMPKPGHPLNDRVVQEGMRLFNATVTVEPAGSRPIDEKQPAQSPKPKVPCKYCKKSAWVWSTVDGPEWICFYCLSSAPNTNQRSERQS